MATDRDIDLDTRVDALRAVVAPPKHDITFIFYCNETFHSNDETTIMFKDFILTIYGFTIENIERSIGVLFIMCFFLHYDYHKKKSFPQYPYLLVLDQKQYVYHQAMG